MRSVLHCEGWCGRRFLEAELTVGEIKAGKVSIQPGRRSCPRCDRNWLCREVSLHLCSAEAALRLLLGLLLLLFFFCLERQLSADSPFLGADKGTGSLPD